MWKRWMAAFLVFTASAAANATIPRPQTGGVGGEHSELARVALSAKQFQAAASAAAKAIELGESNPERNWYRLAIAKTKLGEGKEALLALANAQRLDPSLSFASSPSMIAKLNAEIATLNLGDNTNTSEPMVVNKDDLILLADKIEKINLSLKEVGDSSNKFNSALEAQVQQSARAEVQQRKFLNIVLIGIFLILATTIGLLCAYGYERFIKIRNLKRYMNMGQMPLYQLLEHNGRCLNILQQRLSLHHQQETELSVAIDRLSPVLNRAIGTSRSESKSDGKPLGVVLTGVPKGALKMADPVLGRDDVDSATAALRPFRQKS